MCMYGPETARIEHIHSSWKDYTRVLSIQFIGCVSGKGIILGGYVLWNAIATRGNSHRNSLSSASAIAEPCSW